MRLHRPSISIALVICLLAPIPAGMELSHVPTPGAAPFEQEFVITAYYSPLEGQCCYVKGGVIADRILNGEGIRAADGTDVYPGMLAAPPSYPFGTRVELPGLGILTVHDRGGAIQEQGNVHRLDIWAGSGEEGLARALAFGVQRIKGKVYPVGSAQPSASFALDTLPSPWDELKPFMTTSLLDMRPIEGQKGLSVILLQEHLRDAGYFSHAITGSFGDVTKDALAQFTQAMNISEQPSNALTDTTAAYLLAAVYQMNHPDPVPFVTPESPAPDIKSAQRLMRHLGYYHGRTDGVYTEQLFGSLLAFQQEHALVGDATQPGAGRIGPITKGVVGKVWKQRRIEARANTLLTYRKIRAVLTQRGELLTEYLDVGSNGPMVRSLQELLARQGMFPADKVNGNYGQLTRESVLHYQLARGLITSAQDEAAGMVGPSTLRELARQQVSDAYRHVRGAGWQVL